MHTKKVLGCHLKSKKWLLTVRELENNILMHNLFRFLPSARSSHPRLTPQFTRMAGLMTYNWVESEAIFPSRECEQLWVAASPPPARRPSYFIMILVFALFLVLCHQWHNICAYLYQQMTEFFIQLCSQRQVKCKQRKNYSQRAERKELRPGALLSHTHAAASKLPPSLCQKAHTERRPKWKMKFLFNPSN